MNTQFFQFEVGDDQIGVLTFDVPGRSVNTLSQAVMAELGGIVGELAQKKDLRGLILRSGKPGQFIAGADLKELAMLPYLPKRQIGPLVDGGHQLLGAISNLPYPTVALIDGASMGGGTEVALAMDYRIASTNPATKIALPEIKVGIIPAWGGTQRLPRLIGVHHAIKMISGGEPVDAAEAAKLGLVFDVVPVEQLLDEGRRLIEYAQSSGEWKSLRQRRNGPMGLSADEHAFAFTVAEGYLFSNTKGHYPAPHAALKAMREGVNLPLDKALAVEKAAALEVMGTDISGNLINIFFQDQRLSRDPGIDDASVKPQEIGRVGVLGGGQMGAGIAAAAARSGFPTALVDINDEAVAAGVARAAHVVESRIRIGRASPRDLAEMLGRLSTSTSHQAFADADLVIEAVTENEQLKTDIYRQLDPTLRTGAILASNTSTISITRMAESAPNEHQFAGLHFFYPVDRMKLVEVIRGEKTSDQTVATLVAFAKRIRKTPIVVRDCPGFLVNRILMPYMNEALVLLLEGADMDRIDKVAMKFGLPMGPIALHDFVGVDTCCYAGRVMAAGYPDRAVKHRLLDDMVAAGRLGKKSGAGFRRFDKKGRPQTDPDFAAFIEKNRAAEREVSDEEIESRLILTMLVEATRALEEQIVRQPGDLDMGLILGIGFPAFRGGLLRWADNEAVENLMKRLEPLIPLGKRFEPTETLRRMASSKDQKFYPRPKLPQAAGA